MWDQPPQESVDDPWRRYGSHRRAAALARALQERKPVEWPLYWFIDFYKVNPEYGPSGQRIDLLLRRWRRCWIPKNIWCASATEVLGNDELLRILSQPRTIERLIDAAADVILTKHTSAVQLETIINSEDLR